MEPAPKEAVRETVDVMGEFDHRDILVLRVDLDVVLSQQHWKEFSRQCKLCDRPVHPLEDHLDVEIPERACAMAARRIERSLISGLTAINAVSSSSSVNLASSYPTARRVSSRRAVLLDHRHPGVADLHPTHEIQ
jgi:hypothetical protein